MLAAVICQMLLILPKTVPLVVPGTYVEKEYVITVPSIYKMRFHATKLFEL